MQTFTRDGSYNRVGVFAETIPLRSWRPRVPDQVERFERPERAQELPHLHAWTSNPDNTNQPFGFKNTVVVNLATAIAVGPRFEFHSEEHFFLGAQRASSMTAVHVESTSRRKG